MPDKSEKTPEKGRVLLLQGPSNFFFAELGRAIHARGGSVDRIGFSLGDRLYWRRKSGRFIPCKVSPDGFAAWITQVFDDLRPTDLVMLGDGRFYHRTAIDLARSHPSAPRLHIVEHGLIRPGWLMVEPDGMGSASRIPARFSATPTEDPPAPSPARGASFATYAALDIAYHLPQMLLGPLLRPHYQSPAGLSQWSEYGGWMGKLVKRPGTGRQDRATEAALDASSGPIFLFPLQLEHDVQVTAHGGGESLRSHLKDTLIDFASNAQQNAELVIKRHPLDNGTTPWRSLISATAKDLGVMDRVHYLHGGNLDALLARAAGVVTVNSTVGLQALLAGRPCLTLGTAVYDIEGMTHQGPRDLFWTAPEAPDPDRVDKFRAFLLNHYHVPGSFDGPGARIGADALARRIME